MRKRHLVILAGIGVLALAGKTLAGRQQLWSISHSRRGFAVELRTVPMWASFVEAVLSLLPCTCNLPLPQWAWEVGPRCLGVYEDGNPHHSLGCLGVDLCQLRNSITWRAEECVSSIPLTRDQAVEIDPGGVASCDEIFGTNASSDSDPREVDDLEESVTFAEAVRNEQAAVGDVDAWVERWHTSQGAPYGRTMPMYAYLGLSVTDFVAWVKDPQELSNLISPARERK